MGRVKTGVWKSLLCLLLAVVVASLVLFPFQPSAQAYPLIAQTNPITNLLERIQALFAPPRQARPTGRTKGGAGRGRFCPVTNETMAALVPGTKELPDALQDKIAEVTAAEIVFGKTVEEHPTVWFYIPYQADETLNLAEFMLLDADKHPVLPRPISIQLSNVPGFIQLQIPYSLEINKLYNWYFSIICDDQKPSRNPGVRGWIQRVEPSSQLLTALGETELTRSHIPYIENGIWFESVSRLAENRRRDAEDPMVQRDWVGLLEFLGLARLSDVAIADCCDISN
jgi:Domain of Unknown Function (DUF928)